MKCRSNDHFKKFYIFSNNDTILRFERDPSKTLQAKFSKN